MRKRKFFAFLARVGIAAVLVIAITFALLKVSVVVGNDLVVKLSPLDRSYTLHYPEKANASFTISSINAAFCSATCNYTMEDVSRGEIVDTGTAALQPGQEMQKSYLLEARPGSGQDIYNFRVECANKKDILCISEGYTSSRVALVSVNFEPSEREKELKGQLKQNLTSFLSRMAGIDRDIQKRTLQLENAGTYILAANLTAEIEGIRADFNSLQLEMEGMRSLWHSQNYTYLSKSFNQSYWQTLDRIDQRLSGFDDELSETVFTHNELLRRAKKLGEMKHEAAAKIAMIAKDSERNEAINAFMGELNGTFTAIYSKSYRDYNELGSRIGRLEGNATLLHDSRGVLPKLALGKYLIFSEYDYLCAKGACIRNFSLHEVGQLWNMEPEAAVLAAKEECREIETISRLHSIRIPSPYQDNPEFSVLQSFTSLNERIRIANNYSAQKKGIKDAGLEWSSLVEFIPAESIPSPVPVKNESLLALSTKEILQGMQTEPGSQLLEFNRTCEMIDIPVETGIFDISSVSEVSIPEITVNESTVSTEISDNPPICCIFGECRECCTLCPGQPPVVFVHGHAIDRMNSPEYSLDTFNKIQRRLQKDGYVNAGIVSLSTNLSRFKKGEWGISGAPVTVKVSYYYDIYYDDPNYVLYPKKTEDIETYAVRLKQLIDIVKYRTGQDKVIIVAHSMGGLVSRRYLQIFGEDPVEKLILIGTPNNGIDEELLGYCSLFGGGEECDDMAAKSAFIRKLNDPELKPAKTKVYTIAGSGCSMKGGDGDGLVLYPSARLPYGKNYDVDGSCPTFVNLLHAEMIDPDKHPETYDYIKEILKE